jgi:hypothetical protein
MAVELPPGWAVAAVDEIVPNPNTEGPGSGAFFARRTYICTDQNAQFVCASGSEDDCNNQAQTAAQARTQRRPYYEAI